MYIVAGRYRFPTATFAESWSRVEAEYNPMKERLPGFIDEFFIHEGTEGDHTLVSFVAFFEDQAALRAFGEHFSQVPSTRQFWELNPHPVELLLQGDAWVRVAGKLGNYPADRP